jgi:adenylylsulfate kinase
MAWVIWFTGLPGCGKTTIAKRVQTLLFEKGVKAKILQLDEIRRVVTPQPKYTEEERNIVYASLAYMAKLLSEEGINIIIDATANRRSYRDLARALIPLFGEVYIKAPLQVCMSREAKRDKGFAPPGIYKKAVEEDALVPGVNVVYEPPLSAEIEVDSEAMSSEEAAVFISQRVLDLFGSESL